MADMLQTGMTWLDGQRHAHMTRSFVYQRGVETALIQATVGRTVFDEQDAQGFIHRAESRDYIVRAADLVLNLVLVTPQPGDQIRETVGSTTLVYEVMSPGQAGGSGEPPFIYTDGGRDTLRIHTKLVSVT